MVHPDLLRSFLAVAETRSFTEAARRLGLRQSTVSQHVRRLEDQVRRSLFARDTHSVALTPDGDALCGFARRILDAQDRMERHLAGSSLRGRIRLGASEDFAYSRLPEVLAEFGLAHDGVDLELTVGLSGLLYERYDAGELDVILVKRRGTDPRGESAWQEPLAWIGRPGLRPDPALPLPLVLFPPPSITRAHCLDALQRAGRAWRVACTSGSLSGLRAAALAGLGVTAHSARLVPPGLAPLPPSRHLPALGEIEFVVIGPGPQHRPARALMDAILENAGRLRAEG
ncbi:LysR family transcriptional regulator [Roseomonas haemaphysalidis]|uniref:LysR family transcriptional regulator n=1 Tax=Roseomonas haemaphysalidis TaxID=2768162 RepID=A0ABS3KQC8_9PROT|nr:LysR substrate-binding domain-containing protein [Roseomonas haemaphysalidis]MBO1079672.1 LysR family transcriptional regulator [Roseomonas haemaphysalidis]